MSLLAKAEEMTAAGQTDMLKQMKKQVLTIAFTIGQGLRRDDEEPADYRDRRDDWIDDAETRDDWADVVKKALDDPNLMAAGVLNKIRVIEAAGLQVLDDRVYIKTRLDAVLSTDTHVLIEEVHLVAPSSMLDPDVGGVLVDTPGLGDSNIMRLSHTERAVNEASGVIAFSDSSFSRGSMAAINTLRDMGIVAELAADKARGAHGRSTLFVFNPEKAGMTTRAVPAGERSSVLGNGAPGTDVDALRDQSKEDSYPGETETILIAEIKKLSEDSAQSSRIGKGLARSVIRKTMARPMARNTLVVFPSLRRAIDTATLEEMPEEERRLYIEATHVRDATRSCTQQRWCEPAAHISTRTLRQSTANRKRFVWLVVGNACLVPCVFIFAR